MEFYYGIFHIKNEIFSCLVRLQGKTNKDKNALHYCLQKKKIHNILIK